MHLRNVNLEKKLGLNEKKHSTCLGISEGSYINPFQEVGGPRRFPPKNSKRSH